MMDPPSGDDALRPSEWYAGKVSITLKDATLQASTPLRHAAELWDAMEAAGKLKDGSCEVGPHASARLCSVFAPQL